MMKIFLSALLLFATLFIQTTVFDFFSLGGIKPDFVIIVVIYFALFHKISAAVGSSLVMGLLQDVLSGSLMGLNLLSKSILAYLFSLLGRKVVVINPVNQAILVFLASLLDGGVILFVLRLTQLASPGREILYRLILPQAVYNGLISLILIPLLIKLYRRFFKRRVSVS